MESFLSVDIGTTRLKGLIISGSGTILARYEVPRRTTRKPDGTHEDNAETDWWMGFLEITTELLKRDPNSRVSALAVSGMWPNLVLTGVDHRPIYPAILYDDPRSQEICKELPALLGPNTYGYEILPRLLWFKRNYPEILRKATSFFTTHSYIVYKLTGKPSIDSHTALALGNVLDPLTFRWKYEILDELKIDHNIFPPVYPPNQLVGHVTSQASELSGLPAGVPVFAGFGDTFASLIGSGVIDPGDTFLYAGSTGILLSLSRSIDYICNSPAYPSDDEGVRWILSLPRSGEKFSTIIELFCNPRSTNTVTDCSDLEKNSSTVAPGSGGVKILYNAGSLPSSILGTEVASTISGLRIQTSRYEIYRAALEGFSFLVRSGLESTPTNGPIYISGGGAFSPLLRDILASYLNRTINYVEASQSSLGGALLAASSAGASNLIDVARSIRLGTNRSNPPNRDICNAYDKIYQEYCDLQVRLSQS